MSEEIEIEILKTMKQYKDNDEALLASFFAEHRQPIADNGFTERVMAALPQRDSEAEEALRLRRWSLGLNIFAVVATLGLLVGLGFFGNVWDYLQTSLMHFYMRIIHFDFDGLLVQLMLFLHRLPDMLPNATQLVGIMASLMILTGLSVKKLASSV